MPSANVKIKAAMAKWERRVRDAVRRASERGVVWNTRGIWDLNRNDYWSSHHSAWKAVRRLEERGTITHRTTRGHKSNGYVAKGYTLNPGRTKVVKAD